MTDSLVITDAAFGIVPIAIAAGRYQFLLIQHHAGHWGFPKGHADPGETAIATACREFVEETGITDYTLISDRSFQEQYQFTRAGQTIQKSVVYFLARVDNLTVSCQAAEIQNFAWLDYDAAIAQLTFAAARQILADVWAYLQDQPAASS